MRLLFVMLAWCSLTNMVAAQGNLPKVGNWIADSLDHEDLGKCLDGTKPIGFDRARRRLVCATPGATSAGVISITLSAGTSTTVTNASCTGNLTPHSFCTGAGTGTLSVTSSSIITAGCTSGPTTVGCNKKGMRIARLPDGPIVATTGQFVIPHSRAAGNGEVVGVLVQ